MKIKALLVAGLMALTMVGATACFEKEDDSDKTSSGGDQQNTVTTYTVTFVLNGGEWANEGDVISSYTPGTVATLPIPTKANFTFDGWYTNAEFTGSPVTQITANATGNKTYYAKWSDGSSDSGDGSGSTDDDTEGSTAGTLAVNSFGGYEEGAFIELPVVSGASNASDYKVEYKSTSGAAAYTQIDKDLVRISGDTVRADIVGIKAGDYTIKVTANKQTVEKNVTVTSYDRSGYAHFGSKFYDEGVGGYKDDGTPKSNAIIVYVTNDNKNGVTASGISGQGIVNIIKNSGDKPLIVRVVGQISAATWKPITYDKSKAAESATNITGKNGQQLPTTSDSGSSNYYYISEETLIDGGYNELNIDNAKGITKLNNLTNRINYTKKAPYEYDSYFNMCDVNGVSNVTVEGIGTDATIFQWGFTWKNCNSIEVRNLTFNDYTEDACSFEGDQNVTEADEFPSKNLWVHHNTFNIGKNYWDVTPEQDKDDGDGATDFKGNSYVTISYNHYIENHKTGLVGSGKDSKTANVTFHHNFYDQCSQRLPLGRQANMHMYNNYYYGSTSSSISVRSNAYAFVENCYFEGGKVAIESRDDSSSGIQGYAKVYGCTFSGVDNPCAKTNLSTAYIVEVTNRTASHNNADATTNNLFNNALGKNFDLDSSKFYYKNNKTNVTLLTDAATAKADCKALAGAGTTKK